MEIHLKEGKEKEKEEERGGRKEEKRKQFVFMYHKRDLFQVF